MKKITDELIKTHQVVFKLLEGLDVDNRRFPEITKTLHRMLLAHAWFQDEILLPLLWDQSLIERPFLNQIVQEHRDFDRLLKTLLDTSLDYRNKLEAEVSQIRVIIETHFKKEADVLYPLAEKTIDIETQNRLGDGMAYHQDEIREVAWN